MVEVVMVEVAEVVVVEVEVEVGLLPYLVTVYIDSSANLTFLNIWMYRNSSPCKV